MKFLNKDWCSFFPEYVWKKYIGDVCYQHDLRYGDHHKSRWVADRELLVDVAKRGLPITALVMWTGVRLLGWIWWKKS